MALIIWAGGQIFHNFIFLKYYLVIGHYLELIYSYGNDDFMMITCIKCEQKAITWPCKV